MDELAAAQALKDAARERERVERVEAARKKVRRRWAGWRRRGGAHGGARQAVTKKGDLAEWRTRLAEAEAAETAAQVEERRARHAAAATAAAEQQRSCVASEAVMCGQLKVPQDAAEAEQVLEGLLAEPVSHGVPLAEVPKRFPWSGDSAQAKMPWRVPARVHEARAQALRPAERDAHLELRGALTEVQLVALDSKLSELELLSLVEMVAEKRGFSLNKAPIEARICQLRDSTPQHEVQRINDRLARLRARAALPPAQDGPSTSAATALSDPELERAVQGELESVQAQLRTL